MLGLMLQTMGIGFVYYYGGLAPPQKTRALDAIKSNDEIKVMVRLLLSLPGAHNHHSVSIFLTEILSHRFQL